jgi:hypothetical protein
MESFLEDRPKLWWTTSLDGSRMPATLNELKGYGRWGKQRAATLTTSPENDARVNPEMWSKTCCDNAMWRDEQMI